MSLDRVQNIVLVSHQPGPLSAQTAATDRAHQVLSGKGGVGKSSVTTQLALSLCLAGRAVGVLDIDLTGPSIPRFLGIEGAAISQAPGGWVPVQVHGAQTLPPAPPPTYPLPAHSDAATDRRGPPADDATGSPADEGGGGTRVGALHAVSLGFLLASRDAAVVWRGPKKTAMVRQFLADVRWPALDVLLVDTPPGTSDEHIAAVETLLPLVAAPGAPPARNSDTAAVAGAAPEAGAGKPRLAGAVVVTTPQAVAVADVRKELNFCAKTGVRVLGVVENLSGYVCPCCGVPANLFAKGGGAVMARDFGVPFLGSVPIDGLWGQLVEEGVRPVYGVPGDGRKAEEGDAVDGAEEAKDDRAGQTERSGKASEQVDTTTERSVQGLLVDKYRSCSLRPVFAEITRQVIDTVESGSAAVVKPPA